MTKIEEIEQKLNEASSGFEFVINEIRKELVCYKTQKELKESKKEGKWKPALYELYWYRGDEGINIFDTWENDEIDEWRRENLKIFKTEEACERYWRFVDTVKEKSYEFSELDWRNDDIRKWVIEYNYSTDQLLQVSRYRHTKHFGLVYFKNEADAKYIIDNFKEERLEYWYKGEMKNV